MKLLSFIFSVLLLFSCNSTVEDTSAKSSKQEQDAETITAKDIENLKYTDYALSADANKAVAEWQRYQELMVNVDFLKKADLSFFGGKNELLVTFLKDLQMDIPPSATTPAIKERLIALETKILKLHSTLKLSNVTKKAKLKDIKEILVALSNLHLQINKKFELESQIIFDPSPDGI